VKYFALVGLLAVLVVTGTAAARSDGSSDGTLTVKNADGRVVIIGSRGAVIGHFDRGQVTIKDPNPNDNVGPIVTGADATQSLNEKTTRYSGANIRFRMIGGSFSVTVFGTNIDLSVIGKGLVTLDGTLGAGANLNDDGTYAVNGGAPQPFPNFRFTFPLQAQNSPGG
jgi:hypothetical protein